MGTLCLIHGMYLWTVAYHIHSLYQGAPVWFKTLRPRQIGRHFPDDIFKCIFLNENVWISIRISLKFVSRVPIDNKPALVQIMAWRRPGDKPLSEPMMTSLPMHICVTRPQWVNSLAPRSWASDFKNINLNSLSRIVAWAVGTCYEITLRWMPQNLSNEKSTLVHVMAWCCQEQAIIWANVGPDLCQRTVSIGHSKVKELMIWKGTRNWSV